MKTRIRSFVFLPLGAIALLAGCGGGNSVDVFVSPATATLSTRATQAFSTALDHTGNPAVTWRVQEGAVGGTITSSGVYTAPTTAGTYHVIATSVADSGRTGSATLTVQAGASTLTVN